jgi:hypothetical protein
MKNLGEMMKQAQRMQAQMAEAQARIETIQVTGTSGGGMVEVILTGKGDMLRVSVDPRTRRKFSRTWSWLRTLMPDQRRKRWCRRRWARSPAA